MFVLGRLVLLCLSLTLSLITDKTVLQPMVLSDPGAHCRMANTLISIP